MIWVTNAVFRNSISFILNFKQHEKASNVNVYLKKKRKEKRSTF